MISYPFNVNGGDLSFRIGKVTDADNNVIPLSDLHGDWLWVADPLPDPTAPMPMSVTQSTDGLKGKFHYDKSMGLPLASYTGTITYTNPDGQAASVQIGMDMKQSDVANIEIELDVATPTPASAKRK